MVRVQTALHNSGCSLGWFSEEFALCVRDSLSGKELGEIILDRGAGIRKCGKFREQHFRIRSQTTRTSLRAFSAPCSVGKLNTLAARRVVASAQETLRLRLALSGLCSALR